MERYEATAFALNRQHDLINESRPYKEIFVELHKEFLAYKNILDNKELIAKIYYSEDEYLAMNKYFFNSLDSYSATRYHDLVPNLEDNIQFRITSALDKKSHTTFDPISKTWTIIIVKRDNLQPYYDLVHETSHVIDLTTTRRDVLASNFAETLSIFYESLAREQNLAQLNYLEWLKYQKEFANAYRNILNDLLHINRLHNSITSPVVDINDLAARSGYSTEAIEKMAGKDYLKLIRYIVSLIEAAKIYYIKDARMDDAITFLYKTKEDYTMLTSNQLKLSESEMAEAPKLFLKRIIKGEQ